MKNVVLKFGGTSLANAETIKVVESIINNTKNVRAIVVSAPGKSENYQMKVTDALINACDDFSKFNFYINYVKSIFKDIINDLEINFNLDFEFDRIINHYKKFKNKSFLISRGEYLNAKILSIYLGYKFIDSKNTIKFSTKGKILSITYRNIKMCINKYGCIIIPGFYGSNVFGKIKVMSRGGSDITGSIVAKSIKNSIYFNYTDVDGVYRSCPELTNKIEKIKKLNYDNMKFLSYYGSSVLHYKCCNLYRDGKTIIKNTFNSKNSGTIISQKTKKKISAITLTHGYQVSFNEKNKKLLRLFNRLKIEKLYSFTRLGIVYVAIKNIDEIQKNKYFNNQRNIILIKKIVVYGIIGHIKKNADEIKKEHKNCILYFDDDNKTNIVYSI